MPGFAIIDPATGRILRTGHAPDDAIVLMTGPTEAAISGIEGVTDESHYIGPAGVTPYPPKPGPWAEFDFANEAWFDPRTQADLDAELAAARAGMTLTRRQLMIGLREAGLISQAEARAPRHMPPAAIDAMFAQLPEPEQTRAYITWAEFIEAQRLDPLVAMIAAVAPVPMDDAAIDAFFTTYATL